MNQIEPGNPQSVCRLVHASAVIDAEQVHQPGAMLLEGRSVVAVGSPQDLGQVTDAAFEDRSGQVVMPGLVNAHAHLDLTALGPIPCDQGFDRWLDRIRTGRATSPEGIAEAVRVGVRASLAGGTVAVGDIGGAYSWVPWETLREGPLLGTCYVEVFGTGSRESVGLDSIASIARRANALPSEPDRIRPGLSPHAPHSCNQAVFSAAAQTGLPLASHLAETLEELEYCTAGTGPLQDMLERAGVDTGCIEPHGGHPVDALQDQLAVGAWNIAHLNYPSAPGESPEVRAARLRQLAEANLVVSYCPRASRFFGHPAPGCPAHPYRELLSAGVPVALGTDGMPCLDTPDRLSILDEMRLLHRRDQVEEGVLLAMATVHGARAVGVDPDLVRFTPGPVAGIICAPGTGSDPIRDMLLRAEPPGWVLPPARAELGS